MKNVTRIFSLLFLALGLIGCSLPNEPADLEFTAGMTSEEVQAVIGDAIVYSEPSKPDWWYFKIGSMDYCLYFEGGILKTVVKDEITGSDNIHEGLFTWEVELVLGETPFTTPMAELPYPFAMRYIKWEYRWIANFMGDPLTVQQIVMDSEKLY